MNIKVYMSYRSRSASVPAFSGSLPPSKTSTGSTYNKKRRDEMKGDEKRGKKRNRGKRREKKRMEGV